MFKEGVDGTYIVLNSNIKKMQKKIRQIMIFKRCINSNKDKEPKRPMHEVQEEIKRIRERLDQI